MVKDLVSIIMPSYNTAKYIKESINSVLMQTYKKWELIIIDDNSDDETDEVISEYLSIYQNILYLKNSKNRGAAYSRNRGLRKARGEWIAFLDSDDLWLPSKLEKQISIMKQKRYYFTGTASKNIDENGIDVGIINKSPRHVTDFGMHLYCWPGCLTVVYHRPHVGLVQIKDLKKNNDYAMWLKVVKKCDFYFIDEVLSKYRIRQQSISHDKLKKLIYSHYTLWKIGEQKNCFYSVLLTLINLVFGALKKIIYVDKVI